MIVFVKGEDMMSILGYAYNYYLSLLMKLRETVSEDKIREILSELNLDYDKNPYSMMPFEVRDAYNSLYTYMKENNYI